IFDVAAFEKFLHDRIKVEGRTNNLGERVNITRTDDKIVVEAKIDFSKRYLKYLTKKFLKKNQLRDWLRVVSESKDTYKLKYFNVSNEAEELGDDEEEE
ncbi:60S ribosomal protein L22, partial [Coemansia sp. RSA 2524]